MWILGSVQVAGAQPVESCYADPGDGLGVLIDALPEKPVEMCGRTPFTPRDAALTAPVEGLTQSGDLPLPSRGPGADGYFHPMPGYHEGGTFATPADEPRWAVPDAEIAPPAEPGKLRVVEWNVERGNDLDGIVVRMKEINADVWILNETDFYSANSGNVVTAREMARALGYSYYAGTEFNERRTDRRGSSGKAILSRWPIEQGAGMRIPMFLENGGYDWATSSSEPRCGQRTALSARIRVPKEDGGTALVNFVSLHAENKANGRVRKAQLDAVRAALVVPGEPTVIAGDLNTISREEGRDLRRDLAREFETAGRAAGVFDCSRGDDSSTFSVLGFVRLRLDWMLVQPGTDATVTCPPGRYDVLSAGGASDHKPVVTLFDVR